MKAWFLLQSWSFQPQAGLLPVKPGTLVASVYSCSQSATAQYSALDSLLLGSGRVWLGLKGFFQMPQWM